MDIPLCQSEHKPQLLLNDPAAISLYHTAPEKFAGALAPNAELCDAWAEELAPLPVGLALECPPEPDAEHCERPITMHYIEQCKEVFRPRCTMMRRSIICMVRRRFRRCVPLCCSGRSVRPNGNCGAACGGR